MDSSILNLLLLVKKSLEKGGKLLVFNLCPKVYCKKGNDVGFVAFNSFFLAIGVNVVMSDKTKRKGRKKNRERKQKKETQ